MPAGPAPDLSSTAGRLILALSACYMLFVVMFAVMDATYMLN